MTPQALASVLGMLLETPAARHPSLAPAFTTLVVLGQRYGDQITNPEVNGRLAQAAAVYIHAADLILFRQPGQLPGRSADVPLGDADRDLIQAVRDALEAEVPGGDCDPFRAAYGRYDRVMNPPADPAVKTSRPVPAPRKRTWELAGVFAGQILVVTLLAGLLLGLAWVASTVFPG